MTGESPLNMMRTAGPAAAKARRARPAPAATGGRSSRRWRSSSCSLSRWVWLWYYAAWIADRTLAGWVEREAAAGRVYSCGSQTIGGFPFRIEARCADPVAEIKSNRPPYTVRARTSPSRQRSFIRRSWSATSPVRSRWRNPASRRVLSPIGHARPSVRGRPPDPEGVSVQPRRSAPRPRRRGRRRGRRDYIQRPTCGPARPHCADRRATTR